LIFLNFPNDFSPSGGREADHGREENIPEEIAQRAG
jgi:hypothetical protein